MGSINDRTSESFSGTWEASSTVCESDTLCDATVLISANNPEPHIRNRRLSPGSGSCGGGGGGCVSGGDKTPRQISPDGNTVGSGHAHTISFRKEKERKGLHKGRSVNRESQKGNNRVNERPQKGTQKDRWVEDSLSLLKPPPAFPVQDSPAKLQPAVSYASKVKAKTASGILAEERPAIGVLLQNQWGLSFISEARPSAESPGPLSTQTTDADPQVEAQPDTVLRAATPEETPVRITSSAPAHAQPEVESSEKMLLSCRHLVEALSYHSRGELWGFAFKVQFLCGVMSTHGLFLPPPPEWNAVCNNQKKGKIYKMYRFYTRV